MLGSPRLARPLAPVAALVADLALAGPAAAATKSWQAYRIECTSGSGDCKKEGPVVRFKVE